MSTAATTAVTTPVQITDSVLLAIHTQRTKAFEETQQLVATLYPKWEKTAGELEEFRLKVRQRGSDLQHEKVIPPKKEVLESEREGFLGEYWGFKAESEKISCLCSLIQGTVAMVTPQLRLYAEEQRLASDYPKLMEQMKRGDELGREMAIKLGESLNKVTSLRDKMVTEFTARLDHSMQRFCQVVDNQGRPISSMTRLMDNVTTPVVPKPKPQSTELKKEDSSSSNTPSGSMDSGLNKKTDS
ncbi:MAG: hypothetical protein JSS60_05785 [Verrucomicrobia bacterium]|nr:hypothetical protein [Verrucomicrobiota bacterium]